MKINRKSKILIHLYLNPILNNIEYITSSVEVKRRYVLRALTKLRDEKLVSWSGKEVDERKYQLTHLGEKYVEDLAETRHSRGRNRFPPVLEARMHFFGINDRVDINITSKSELDYILFKLLFERCGARVGGVGYGGVGRDLTYRFGVHLQSGYKEADGNHRELINIWNRCGSTSRTNRNYIELTVFQNAIDYLHETGWFREYFVR